MVGPYKDNTYFQQFNVLYALTWYAVKCTCGLLATALFSEMIAATFLGGFAPPATWANLRSVLAWH